LLTLVITGAVSTVSVKLCVEAAPTPLLAVNVMGYMAALPDAGVPLSVPVPFPLSTKVTPFGKVAPPSLTAGGGKPVVITVNDPGEPTVNVTLVGLMMAGAWSTVRVKLCEALPELFVALKVIGYVPPVPAPGVPLRMFVVVLNVTPAGSVPVSVKDGAGVPVATTVNVPPVPTVKVVLLALVITGAVFTVSVKVWLACVPTPLLAVKLMGYVPLVPAAGVPLRTPVAGVNVTPAGSVPVSPNVGAGNPVAVTVKVPAAPTLKVALFALVIIGAWSTVSVKLCEVVPELLVALKVIEYVPPVPAAGVPLRTPVVVLNVTPVGSAPVSLNVGAGNPVAVTVKVPPVPTVKVVLLALVMAGGWPTVSVKFCTASAPMPLCAVNMMG
jgi:hypothetical protein